MHHEKSMLNICPVCAGVPAAAVDAAVAAGAADVAAPADAAGAAVAWLLLLVISLL